MTVDEAAAMLQISRGLAFEGVKRGEIPSVRIGRRILIPRSRLLELINGRPTEAA
jgi:excisionase family DNA binding protein